jgi:hypothetical protein
VLKDLAVADAAVRGCVDAPVWALSEPQLIAALDAVHGMEQRLAAVKLALVRELDGRGVPVAHGASSTAVWLRERLRLSIAAGRRLVTDAVAVDAAPAGPVLRQALAAGAVTVEQARGIAEAVVTVHQQAGVEAANQAVRLLVDWAGRFEPGILRGLGARILAHVAPEVAEQAEKRALAEADTRADRHRHLTWSTGPDGQTRLTGRLDPETGALLHAALDPLCAPHGLGDDRTPGQRRHDALAEICRLALRTSQLPEHGGDPVQVVVTTDYDTLHQHLTAGTLDTGIRLAPATVRRLACDAAILPAVLGGHSQVLDLGRQRRLITGPLRRALVLRDGGCSFPGCDRPPRWTDAHHVVHWADGGNTSLDNTALLCRHHHREIHRHDWQVRIAADGHPEFLPPTWVDPDQRPRRNQYHRRT